MDFGSVTNFFAAVPADWIILGIVAALFLFDAIRVGSGRIAVLGVAITIAVQLSAAMIHAAYLGSLSVQFNTPVLQAALFAVLLVALFFLLRRVFIDYGETGGQPIQAIFAAIAATALVVTAWVQIEALTSVWNFGPQVKAVFGEAYRFWWLIISFAALAFSRA